MSLTLWKMIQEPHQIYWLSTFAYNSMLLNSLVQVWLSEHCFDNKGQLCPVEFSALLQALPTHPSNSRC